MSRRDLIAGLLLGLVGFAVNWFKLPLFFDVDFLFGSILSMYALLRFGLGAGVLAAVVAASCTWLHWLHPWAILSFSVEALCVGLLLTRRRMGLMAGALLFWSTVGLVLVWFCYHHLLDLPHGSALLIALKQGVNGIFNVLIAELVFLLIRRGRERGPLFSLHERLRIILQGVVLVPAFLVVYADIADSFGTQMEFMRQTAVRATDVARLAVANWLAEERHKVLFLADLIRDPETASPEEMQRILDAFRAAHSDSFRIGVLDGRHVTRAFSPARDDLGRSTVGIDLGDRPYVEHLRKRGRPVLHEAFVGSIGTPGPRLLVFAPFWSGNEYRGAISHALSLEHPQELLRGLVVHREGVIDITLVDNDRQVILSTRSERKTLEPFTLPADGKLVPSGAVMQWLPEARPGVGAVKRWSRSFLLREVDLSADDDFQLVVEISVAPTIRLLTHQTSLNLGALALVMLLVFALSRWASRRLLRPIAVLGQATRQLPDRLLRGERIDWAPAIAREEEELQENFRRMEEALQGSFDELTVMKECLEERVAERTAELAENRRFLADLIENSGTVIFVKDRELRYTIVNRSLEKVTGMAREAVLGHSDEELFPGEVASCFRENDLEVMAGGRLVVFDETMDGPQGVRHFLSIKFPTHDAEGRVNGVCGMSTDISERILAERELRRAKEAAEASERAKAVSEERLNLVLDGAQDAFWDWDLVHDRIDFSRHWAAMLGYTHEELEPYGESWERLVHPEDMPEAMEKIQAHLEGHAPYIEAEYRVQTKEGEWKWILDRGKIVVWDAAGKPLRAAGTHADITRRKMIEEELQTKSAMLKQEINQRILTQEELREKQEQLEMLNRSLCDQVEKSVAELRQKDQVLISQGRQAAMGEMIGNIAHQWRQPLNALAMLITNLQFAWRDGDLSDDYLEESAATAHRLIQKMSTTINDFRDFFSPDKVLTTFSALSQIRQAIALVESGFKANNIALAVEDEEDCLVKGFPNEYSQVLLNLLGNAKDAILQRRPDSGQVVVSLAVEQGQGVARVRDNGGGVPEKIIDKIFDPYFSTKSMGTGIGLYMSKTIIERNMHGIISVRNIEGGCEFSVALPLAEQP
ncbi:PAS domain S-box protein [Trichloromonas acetexigens]|uniref:histidine kinase n=1 Tax=Trichloromonas acetexigens TaxID=38815 RepID=A0A550J6R8_9BACT|nr:PAS domain S-box protein [Desulfuromonas acetexigens]TRO78916.1 PAS domain S-box protein [Desulfuromonas acetexigens]